MWNAKPKVRSRCSWYVCWFILEIFLYYTIRSSVLRHGEHNFWPLCCWWNDDCGIISLTQSHTVRTAEWRWNRNKRASSSIPNRLARYFVRKKNLIHINNVQPSQQTIIASYSALLLMGYVCRSPLPHQSHIDIVLVCRTFGLSKRPPALYLYFCAIKIQPSNSMS